MSELPFTYPVIGIGPHADPRFEGEEFLRFRNEVEVTSVDPADDIADRLGMSLIDATGQSWKIRSLKKVGAGKPWLARIAYELANAFRTPRIELDLVEQPPIPLEEIKARVCGSIKANADIWRDDEAIAGEAAPPREEEEMLDELMNEVRRAGSVAEMVGNIDALLSARGVG